MGFPRQEYWDGLPFASPKDLTNPGNKPACVDRWILYCWATRKAQLDSYPHTKTVLVKLWSPLEKIQQHSRTVTTKLRINAQKEKEDSLVLPSSSDPSSILQHQARTPQEERLSLLRKEEWVKWRASSAFWGTIQNAHFDFTPLRQARLRSIEITRNKEK